MMANSSVSLMTALKSEKYTIDDVFDMYASPITQAYLPGGPWYLITIVSIYLSFVLYFGPLYMKNRKPFDLQRTIKIYNLINIAINSLWFLMALYFSNMVVDCWGCQDSAKPLPLPITLLGGLGYMVLKVFDLMDTVFFILRKKFNQATFLHISHHAIMPFTAWFATKYAPGVSTALTPTLNSAVHIVMYSYYYFVSQGVQLNWIKKRITQMQMVQFVIISIHALHLIVNPTCDYPKWFACVELSQGLFFLSTFSNFYLKSYKNQKVE